MYTASTEYGRCGDAPGERTRAGRWTRVLDGSRAAGDPGAGTQYLYRFVETIHLCSTDSV